MALLRYLRALLRELGDEAAYERHLHWHGRTHSEQEWRSFQDERAKAKYARPKCC